MFKFSLFEKNWSSCGNCKKNNSQKVSNPSIFQKYQNVKNMLEVLILVAICDFLYC
jgi:hypothetical protein